VPFADIMKTLIVLLITVASATSAYAQTLCVATYNLNYSNQRGDQVLDAISKANPDLICFQETTEQSELFLKEKLAQSHSHFYSVGHEGRYLAERFAFACKSELTDTEFVPPGAGLFGFYTATLNFNGERIQIVNIHLAPFQVKRGGTFMDAMAALYKTEKIHADEIDVITKSMDTKRPVIIAGDFNSISTFVAPQRLVELGMIDAFASVTKDPDTHATWHWPTRPIPLALRIDYIFHSNHFTTQKSEVLRRDGSDHSLVYAVLERGEQSLATEPAVGSVLESTPIAPAR